MPEFSIKSVKFPYEGLQLSLSLKARSGGAQRFVEWVANGDPKWSDDELLDFMMAHPILINRPIVVTPKGVRLCRPSEVVLSILPNASIGRFVEEDGEVVAAPGAQAG